jgi:hypothetical protein
MKKILFILALALSLAGCETNPPKVEPSIIIKYKYVAAPIPADHLVIPPKVEKIDLSTATQREVADWLARSEGRTKDLETKLNQIKKFQAEQQPNLPETK